MESMVLDVVDPVLVSVHIAVSMKLRAELTSVAPYTGQRPHEQHGRWESNVGNSGGSG